MFLTTCTLYMYIYFIFNRNGHPMTEEVPIFEVPTSRLWLSDGLGFRDLASARRMNAFVLEMAGAALFLDPAAELHKMKREELFALAVQAQRAGLQEDVVGTLLVLAIDKNSHLGLLAFGQLLGQRFESSGRNGGDFAGRRELGRALRGVARILNRGALLEKFDDFRKECEAAAEAVTLRDTLAAFRRAGVNGSRYRVLAPALKSLRHLEGGGDEFQALMGPLPCWRPPVGVDVLAQTLAGEFPHLADIAADVANFVVGGAAASACPILLLGPPAIGKDSLLRRAAELVGRPHAELDLAGTSDNRTLQGTAKGWSSATPSHPATVCARTRCANPLLQYSELDRSGGSRRNGMVHETLLGLCEPTTRKRWHDVGLGTELDLSDVAVAFTANGTDDTPAALLSRLRVIMLGRPKPEHVAAILVQARRRYASELQLPIDSLPEVTPQAVQRLEAVARQGRFNLRLADRIVRALGRTPAPQRLN